MRPSTWPIAATPSSTAHPALQFALAVADQLAEPAAVPFPTSTGQEVRRQSLAYGAPGTALLHIELAARELRPWRRAHDWLAYAACRPVATGTDSNLFYGAPAIAHALASAATAKPGSYSAALESLDTAIRADIRARLDAAHARLDAGDLPALAEFDVIRGLSGLGSYLVRRDGDTGLTRDLLTYFARLTQPVENRWNAEESALPGWWTETGPSGRPSGDFPCGHSNNGLAHGIAGPLAMLSTALLNGIQVDQQRTAVTQILTWYDRWFTDTGTGPAWPYTIAHADLAAGRTQLGRVRPSWCYGAAGIARAQQLAALATCDPIRRRSVEATLARALADPAQCQATTDTSLCHGFAGLAHLAAVTATDAAPDTAERLQKLTTGLLDTVHPPDTDPTAAALTAIRQTESGCHFLEGAAGTALAVLTPATGIAPISGWDHCLLTAPTTDHKDPLR